MAFSIFDERIARIARQFEDFRNAEAAGAILSAGTIAELARLTRLPETELTQSFRSVDDMKRGALRDALGREFRNLPPLAPPFKAVQVTGALFHTQGGLAVDREARVVGKDDAALLNLFAAGGAAEGVSGSTAAGYLSGNGLLTATALGRIAGRSAAASLRAGSPQGPSTTPPGALTSPCR
jgi:fumarate reductase flavoprotein subunit